MSTERIVVGLEIGTSKVCAVVASLRREGEVKILGVGQAPSRGVRKSEIVDFETASKCVREALVDAEEKSDVEIRGVFLAVSGGHIKSFNNRGMVSIPEDRGEIYEEDFEDVQAAAREVTIPPENSFLLSLVQHYYVDGQDGVLNPVGMMGRKLEADFHIIHGVSTRIKNSLRCLAELDIDVEDVVFSPVAAAQVVFDQAQKNLGGLMIDLGGGTTGYVLYADGAMKRSGCLSVGGDHVTNDISLGLRIPMARAERLKVEQGSVSLEDVVPGEMIVLKDETGFAGREIERAMLNNIIHCRVRETLELVRRDIGDDRLIDFLGAGVFLTGGGSLMDGVEGLVQEVFGHPVQLTHKPTVSGVTSAFDDPLLSTAIGLTKYAHATQETKPEGWFKRLIPRIRLFGR
jgi:cell division protein FtsA